MAELNVGDLVKDMVGAALPILSSGGTSVKEYAETEFKKIGLQLEFIAKEFADGNLTEAGAKALLQMQANSAKILLLTLEGLSLIVVERAINTALDVVKGM